MIAPPFDAKAFRQALGSFTTGVTIVTARDADGQPVGLTANSFNSVSLDPPLVLWSLARSARSLPVFEAAEHFAVHILSAEQEALSNRFASRGEDKFAGLDVAHGAGGVPLLPGCSARLQCRTTFRYEGGDHLIFVGEVLAFDRQAAAPLVFHAGRYAIATQKPAPSPGSGFGDELLGFLLSRTFFDLYARVEALHLAEGFDAAQFFLLTCLLARNGQRLSELNRRYRLTGQQITHGQVQLLVLRGLVQAAVDPDAPLTLAPEGRECALRLLAAMKSVEADVQAQLGDWESHSLIALLRRLQTCVSPGLPDPWAAEPTAG